MVRVNNKPKRARNSNFCETMLIVRVRLWAGGLSKEQLELGGGDEIWGKRGLQTKPVNLVIL